MDTYETADGGISIEWRRPWGIERSRFHSSSWEHLLISDLVILHRTAPNIGTTDQPDPAINEYLIVRGNRVFWQYFDAAAALAQSDEERDKFEGVRIALNAYFEGKRPTATFTIPAPNGDKSAGNSV